MLDKTWTVLDKSTWLDGPWQDEPDKQQWVSEITGVACMVVRPWHRGHWCGYVGVHPGHPWHGITIEQAEAKIPAGISWSAASDQDGPERRVVRPVLEAGEVDDFWWVGFDHGHVWDIQPAMEARELAMGWPPIRVGPERYTTLAEVRGQVEMLALLAAAATGQDVDRPALLQAVRELAAADDSCE